MNNITVNHIATWFTVCATLKFYQSTQTKITFEYALTSMNPIRNDRPLQLFKYRTFFQSTINLLKRVEYIVENIRWIVPISNVIEYAHYKFRYPLNSKPHFILQKIIIHKQKKEEIFRKKIIKSASQSLVK